MTEPSVEQLLDKAEDLKWGDPSALVLGEQAIRLADTHQDECLQYWARTQSISYAVACGQMDKALLFTAWCVSRPDLLNEVDNWTRYLFLWNIKMVWHGTYEFPHITLEKISEISSQMSRLHREHGYNQRPTEFIQFSNDVSTGNFEAAAESYQRFLAIPRDDMADCEACEINSQVGYLARILRDEEAIEIAKPVIHGELSCVEVPHGTYCELIKPLLRLGDKKLADEYHQIGFVKVRSNPFLLREAAIHIGYDVYLENYKRAIPRFERQLATAMQTPELHERFCFYTVAEWLMERLAERGRARKMKLPAEFPLHNDSNQYDCGQLHNWFKTEVAKLADAFDQRNGNDFYRTRYRRELRYETVASV